MADDFTFARAVRRQTWAVLGLAGPSGGGKTWTGLEIGSGLAEEDGGKIALISTEGSRDLYYADHFNFDRLGLEPPYTPERCLDALQAAQDAGYRVVIFDSFSDEYIGEGGLVDLAAAESGGNEAAKWARPKARHKKIIRWLRNSARCHLIFNMRAEEKVKLVKVMKNGREQTVVEPIGYQPIAEKSFMFDMMESALVLPDMRDREGKIILADARGVPQWIKPMSQHLAFFPEGKPITREAGRMLARWCAGGEVAPPRTVEQRLRDAAELGKAEIERVWRDLSREERDPHRHLIGNREDGPGVLTKRAVEVDAAAVADLDDDEIPFEGDDTAAGTGTTTGTDDDRRDNLGLLPIEEARAASIHPGATEQSTAPGRVAGQQDDTSAGTATQEKGSGAGGAEPAGVQADLLGGDAGENLFVPLDRARDARAFDYWKRQMLGMIEEQPNNRQRNARIKLINEGNIAKLKAADPDGYSEVMRALL